MFHDFCLTLHSIVIGYFYFSNRNIILIYRYLVYNRDDPYGPFTRQDIGRRGTMICYNLHSVVENNQQPAKMQKEEDKYKYASESMCFFFSRCTNKCFKITFLSSVKQVFYSNVILSNFKWFQPGLEMLLYAFYWACIYY